MVSMVSRSLLRSILAVFLLVLVPTDGYRMPSLRKNPSYTRQQAWLPDFDISGISDSIGNLDQFFQGALNTASSSDSLAAPVGTAEVKNIFLESDSGYSFLSHLII